MRYTLNRAPSKKKKEDFYRYVSNNSETKVKIFAFNDVQVFEKTKQ